MEYPTDQAELKAFLLSNPDIALEWLEKKCIPFAKAKFKNFRVGPLLKSRCDLDQLLQDIRIWFWMKLLPNYDETKCADLKAWTCFCIRRWVITYFKQLMSNTHPLNRMLTICDVTEDDGGNANRTSWLETFVTKEEEDREEKELCEEVFNDLVAGLAPMLSETEQEVLDAVIHIYKQKPHMVKHGCMVPMGKVAIFLGMQSKQVDNTLQRIRRKIDLLGLR